MPFRNWKLCPARIPNNIIIVPLKFYIFITNYNTLYIKIHFKFILINVLTLPKYLSNNSTYRCIISKVSNSLSFCSIAQQKYKLAYLRVNKIFLIKKNSVFIHREMQDFRLNRRLSIAYNYVPLVDDFNILPF